MIIDRGQIAFESPECIEACTNELLARHAAYCYEHSAFYRGMFDNANLSPGDIQTVADLTRLPLTRKADLETSGNDFLCIEPGKIVDVCQTSGTTGMAISMYQSASDLQRVGYNEELSFRAAGVSAEDRVLIACALGRCFMAGMAYFEGLRRISAMSIRAGSGVMSVLANSVQTHHPTVIIGVPSQLLALAGALETLGSNPQQMGVRMLICIGEAIRQQDLSLTPPAERLAVKWQADVRGTYASTEMATAFAECQAGAGGHVHPDLMAVEIVDESGATCEPGHVGQVIATPLQVTAMPLMRFATGDMAAMYIEPCKCGRNTLRLSHILGRKSHMLKIRGTTVFPEMILSVVRELVAVDDCYIEIRRDGDLSDHVTVVVSSAQEDELNGDNVAERIRGKVRVGMDVIVASVEEVTAKIHQADRRKPCRVFDVRSNTNM